MKLIIGLGNPGRGYAHNRHNIGFHCIDYIARAHDISVKKSRCESKVGAGDIGGIHVLLAKPKTYVNISGEAVSQLMRKYKAPVEDIIVIHDDLDLPLGMVRIRRTGGSGGHNGLKSIISCIGSKDFSRIRIGIGRPAEGSDFVDINDPIVDHVLNDFSPEEEKTILPAIVKVEEAVECILTDGITEAMNRFNRKRG
jgi:PTH1 family peptidyl-tRNA hydrolase